MFVRTKARRAAATLALVLGLAFLVFPTAAADVTAPAPQRPLEAIKQATESYLEAKAVLLMIRATFNVAREDEIEHLLENDLRRIGPRGPNETDFASLDRDLWAEGDYYLVSLRYLIEAGGAAWPSDRPAANYENDALVQLDALEDHLVDGIAAETDLLPVFIAAQAISALTNGQKGVPPEADHFSRRDAIVAEALARAAPWSET